MPRRLVALKTTLLLLTSSKAFTCHLAGSSRASLQLTTHQVLDIPCRYDSEPLIAVDSTSSTICVTAENKVYVALDETKDTNFAEDRVNWKILNVPNQITSIACTMETIVVGEQSGTIRLFFDVFKSIDTNGLPPEAHISWHQSPLSCLQLSPNGSFFSFSILLI